jgi:hypothetical protein
MSSKKKSRKKRKVFNDRLSAEKHKKKGAIDDTSRLIPGKFQSKSSGFEDEVNRLILKNKIKSAVSRAKFRGTRECSRCGADLTGIMILSARAQRTRANARESLYALNFEKAREFAAAAQKEHATETGRRLLLLTSWLNAEL